MADNDDMPQYDEIERTFALRDFGSYAKLRQALTSIQDELVEKYIVFMWNDSEPHSRAIAFDGLFICCEHTGLWQARLTVTAPQAFVDFMAEVIARYS